MILMGLEYKSESLVNMKKDSQFYSKIAFKYLQELSRKDGVKYNMVCYGNLIDMEELFDLFGGDRNKLDKQNIIGGQGVRYRFKYVMDKLERESKKPDAIFKKSYICYNGIINRPTRCFYFEKQSGRLKD